jgi:hypothetical protein
LLSDPAIQHRKEHLIKEARLSGTNADLKLALMPLAGAVTESTIDSREFRARL